MLDAADLVSLLSIQWSISTPAIGTDTTSSLFINIDEYDPRVPVYQIVIKNRPLRPEYLAPNCIKLEQELLIELHVRPVRFDPDTIGNFRTIWKNIKGEVTRILNKYRFDSVGNTIDMTTWVDSKVPHGFDQSADPLEIVSTLTLHIISVQVDV